MSYLKYNPKLKERARELRKNSTRSEIVLWKSLRGGQIRGYTFNRQKPIDKYIVDFYNKKLRLVIEIDGCSHDEKQEYDKKRQNRLEALGCTVIRFNDDEVIKHLDGVIHKIEEIIKKLATSNNASRQEK